MSGLLPRCRQGPRALSHPTCFCSVWLGRCDRCDLLVDLDGFHPISVARRECGLVLDRESCDRCAGYPSCGLNRSRSRTRGGGGDRRTSCRGSCADPVAQYDAGSTENAPDRSCLSSSRTVRCTPPRALVSLRGSHYLGPGPPVRNHAEHRVVPYQAVSASRI